MYFYIYNRTENLNKPIAEFSNSETPTSMSQALLKIALHHYNKIKVLGLTETQIENIEIAKGTHGKPYFPQFTSKESDKPSIFFSISHSGPWWGCIFSDIPVGLDLEDCQWKRNKTRNFETIAKRFFTKDEYDFVMETGKHSFYDLWVRKEAYIKMKGTGLSEGLASFQLLEKGKLAEKIEGAYFTEIHVMDDVKIVFCAKEKRELHQIYDINGG